MRNDIILFGKRSEVGWPVSKEGCLGKAELNSTDSFSGYAMIDILSGD